MGSLLKESPLDISQLWPPKKAHVVLNAGKDSDITCRG